MDAASSCLFCFFSCLCCICRHLAGTCTEQGRKKVNLWAASLRLGEKHAYLGSYASKQEAGVVWDAASVWRSTKAPGEYKLILIALHVCC